MTALASQPMFKVRRSRYINMITEDLASLLATVVPRTSMSELQGSLRRTIVEPAAELAHQLHLASSVYSLKWPARSAWLRLEVYECLNIASGGMILDLSGTGPTSPARRKVSYLFDVAPGLFVERIEGGKKLPLRAICKPHVVVYAGAEEAPQRTTVMRWLWDHSSGPQSPTRDPPPRAATPKSKHAFSGRSFKL